MNGFGWWVVQNAAATALLLPLVWLLCRLRPSRPAEQHLLWLLLLLKFVTPPVVNWPWPAEAFRYWNEPTQIAADPPSEELLSQGESSELLPLELAPPPEVVPAPDVFPIEMPSVSPTRPEPPTPLAEVGPPESIPLVAAAQAVPTEPELRPTPTSEQSDGWLALTRAIAAVWLAGAVVVCFRTALQVRRQRRVLRSALECPAIARIAVEETARDLKLKSPRVLVSTAIDAPFVSCLFRPVLVWPASLAGEESLANCRGVLAHELAHVRRRDHWVVRLETLGAPLWWWDPVYWFVRRRLDETRELACDALAVESACSDRKALADLLLAFSTSGRPSPSFAPLRTGIASRHSLRRRLAMLFDHTVSGRISFAAVALTVLLAAAALPGWARGQEQPTNEIAPASDAADAESPAEAAASVSEPPAADTRLPFTEAGPAPLSPVGPPAAESIPPETPVGLPTIEPAPADAAPVVGLPQVGTNAAAVGEGRTFRVEVGPDGKTVVVHVFKNGKEAGTLSGGTVTIDPATGRMQVSKSIPASPGSPSRSGGPADFAFPQPRATIAPPISSATDVSSADQRLLKNALELALLDVQEKQIQLENGKQRQARQKKLYESGYAAEPPDDVRLLEIELKRAQLRADQARVQLEGAMRGTPEPATPPAYSRPVAESNTDARVRSLEAALQMALLEVDSKRVLLEKGKQEEANWQQLYDRKVVGANERPWTARLAEIELKQAELKAAQAQAELDAVRSSARPGR